MGVEETDSKIRRCQPWVHSEVTALGHPSGGTVPLHPTFSTGDSALPVVGLVPSSPKWRQGEPTGSPKPSLLLSWT